MTLKQQIVGINNFLREFAPVSSWRTKNKNLCNL